jgi:hypothetical protein
MTEATERGQAGEHVSRNSRQDSIYYTAVRDDRLTMSARSAVSTGEVISFLPANLMLAFCALWLSYSKPLVFKERPPSNPGAPDAGTNACAANGVP